VVWILYERTPIVATFVQQLQGHIISRLRILLATRSMDLRRTEAGRAACSLCRVSQVVCTIHICNGDFGEVCGCGIGNFLAHAPEGMRFIGVELDSLSGRIARVLHPSHDIRIENFRDTRLPENRIDTVIGNVPFADLRLDYHGTRLALHDFFLAKSLDALKPGGVLALVTSHYTLDKQDPALRAQLAQQADFLGAIRLPAEAFQQEGTRGPCTCTLRINPPGSPADLHRDKKVCKRGLPRHPRTLINWVIAHEASCRCSS
jgi:SAM-dependent methyltransferase